MTLAPKSSASSSAMSQVKWQPSGTMASIETSSKMLPWCAVALSPCWVAMRKAFPMEAITRRAGLARRRPRAVRFLEDVCFFMNDAPIPFLPIAISAFRQWSGKEKPRREVGDDGRRFSSDR